MAQKVSAEMITSAENAAATSPIGDDPARGSTPGGRSRPLPVQENGEEQPRHQISPAPDLQVETAHRLSFTLKV
ncbi:MAG: hypothetical protein H6891_08290 [Brucellaceae bacterium]|nr:hypothetical protein [Brucellaceae bacterium]